MKLCGVHKKTILTTHAEKEAAPDLLSAGSLISLTCWRPPSDLIIQRTILADDNSVVAV